MYKSVVRFDTIPSLHLCSNSENIHHDIIKQWLKVLILSGRNSSNVHNKKHTDCTK